MPERDHSQLKEWCGYRAALSWGRPVPQDQIEIAASIAAYRRYLRDLVDRKRICARDAAGPAETGEMERSTPSRTLHGYGLGRSGSGTAMLSIT